MACNTNKDGEKLYRFLISGHLKMIGTAQEVSKYLELQMRNGWKFANATVVEDDSDLPRIMIGGQDVPDDPHSEEVTKARAEAEWDKRWSKFGRDEFYNAHPDKAHLRREGD